MLSFILVSHTMVQRSFSEENCSKCLSMCSTRPVRMNNDDYYRFQFTGISYLTDSSEKNLFHLLFEAILVNKIRVSGKDAATLGFNIPVLRLGHSSAFQSTLEYLRSGELSATEIFGPFAIDEKGGGGKRFADGSVEGE